MKKDIIIIEDNRMVRSMIQFTLDKLCKFNYHCYEDYQMIPDELLKKCEFIILDHCLIPSEPGSDLNGLTFLEKLQENYSDIPVIMFSGEQDFDFAFKSFLAGAFDYVNKNENNCIDNLSSSISALIHIKQKNTESKNRLLKMGWERLN